MIFYRSQRPPLRRCGIVPHHLKEFLPKSFHNGAYAVVRRRPRRAWDGGVRIYRVHILTSQTRLYSKGKIMGHRRGKRSQHPNVTLVKIEGVESAKDAQFYLGKVRTPSWDGREQILTASAHCLHLQGAHREARHPRPRDLGPCHPDTRWQRCCAQQVPPQHPPQGLWRVGARPAVPEQQYVCAMPGRLTQSKNPTRGFRQA